MASFLDRILAPITSRVKRDLVTSEEKYVGGGATVTGYLPSSRAKQYLKAYRNWVYANVTVIARKTATMEFRLNRVKADGSEQEVLTHEVLELLSKVNTGMTSSDLLFLTSCHLDLTGEAMWFLPRPTERAKPTEIFPVRPDCVEVVPGDPSKGEPLIKAYKYRVPDSAETVTFNWWEVLFFKYPDPENVYRGLSPVKAAALMIDTDEGSWEWNSAFFFNSAQPGAVLQTDQKLSDKQFNRIIKAWQARFNGTKNAHKTTVLDSGLKFVPTQGTHKDMDFLEQQRWTRDSIMAMYQNTKVALGIVEDVNRASAETSEMVWTKHAIVPRMQRIVDTINEFLMPVYGKDLYLDFANIVPQDKEYQLALLSQGTNTFLTINEAREQLGLPPLVGGDVLYLPITQTPAVGDGQPAERMALQVSEKELTKPITKQARRVLNRNVVQKKLTAAVAEQVKPLILKMVQDRNKAVRRSTGANERRAIWWQKQVGTADGFKAAMVAKLQEILNQAEDDTLARLIAELAKKRKQSAKALSAIFQREEWKQVIEIAMAPILEGLIRKAGQDSLDFFEIGGNYEMDERAARYIRMGLGKLSTSITATQKEKITDALADGISAGEGIDQLSDRVRKVFGDLREYQAKAIAQTESIRAANFASRDAWEQSGVVEGKEWVTEHDGSVCPYCDPLDGKVIDIDDSYFKLGDKYRGDADTTIKVDYADVGEPPLHVNCRCVIVPVLVSVRSLKTRLKQQAAKEPSHE